MEELHPRDEGAVQTDEEVQHSEWEIGTQWIQNPNQGEWRGCSQAMEEQHPRHGGAAESDEEATLKRWSGHTLGPKPGPAAAEGHVPCHAAADTRAQRRLYATADAFDFVNTV
ncbi:hypothetical protein NDU88_004881 [Pleurodeles waltl]|uniref:Uncharacterized protein n=1 Tax=Pleurodeles waltl TaxID=8319 RepID=A0AAV7MUP6_PLEWA|nr:hypothetical protein NDU88_004881 [Pleurodeles waltl]